jgi:hypothetical protein
MKLWKRLGENGRLRSVLKRLVKIYFHYRFRSGAPQQLRILAKCVSI